MTQHFKGKIINTKKLPNLDYVLNIAVIKPDYGKTFYYVLDNSSFEVRSTFRKYSNNDLKKTIDILNKIINFNISLEDKDTFDSKMIDIFKKTVDFVSDREIIYERVIDKNGDIYGKEILTGLLFPINCRNYSYNINYSYEELERVLFDVDHNKAYTMDDSYPDTFIELGTNKHCEVKHEYYISAKFLREESTEFVIINGDSCDITLCKKPLSYKISLEPKMNFLNYQRVDYTIVSEKIASELEVYNYLHQFDHGFGRKKHRIEYENTIRKLSLSNYLGEIINVSRKDFIKEKVSESSMTFEMQELEFLLQKLKSVSLKDYEIINKEYVDLLNQNDSELHVTPLSINSIILLQNKVKLAFICHGGEINKIIEFLEREVNNYLENYKTGSTIKTELSIKDLDRFCEYFLNSKNAYSIKEQNEILKYLSLLYFFEIYENIDVLTVDDLINSYASNNIKRILVIIDVLHEDGFIKNVSNCLYDISDLEMFIEFIKKVKFADRDDILIKNGQELIKKIQR